MIDVAAFRRDGYVVIPGLLSAAETAQLKGACDSLLEFLVNSSLANERTSHRLDVRTLPTGAQVVRKIQPFIDLSERFRELAGDSRILNLVSTLLTEPPELIEDKITYKQHLSSPIRGIDARQAEDRFMIHCDWAYHQEQGYPPSIVNAAVTIDNAPSSSGPLKVWPGTHREPYLHEKTGTSYVVGESQLKHIEPREILTEAGALILFHGCLLHSSEPNTTGLPRRMAIFSYLPCSQSIGPDVRNGPTRAEERPFEEKYRALREAGIYKDQFRVLEYEA